MDRFTIKVNGCYECLICGKIIPTIPAVFIAHIVDIHVLNHKGNAMVIRDFWGTIIANFRRSQNSKFTYNAVKHIFGAVVDVFPQITLLKVDAAPQERLHARDNNTTFDGRLWECLIKNSSGLDSYPSNVVGLCIKNYHVEGLCNGTGQELLQIMRNTDYYCCVCDNPYDAGLPSMEIVIQHNSSFHNN